MLTKPENKINWKDSNLALFGSDLEKKIKAASAEKERAWDGLGKSVAFRVWRIEKFLVKEWPKRKYGKFHKGDSYIILNSYKEDPSKEKLLHDIYIWIGDESTQDEYGTAAYKMVELDNKLGGTAVQHRETQGKESAKFLDYFGKKITYLEGGIESGFHHVEASPADPLLLHIKGHVQAGTLRMTQEPCRRDAMNSGDVFVLSAGEDACWLWIGKESNKDEKAKGMDVAKAFCTKGTVRVLDEGVNDGPDEARDFWQHVKTEVAVLGPIKRKVTVQRADENDDGGRSYVPTLFRIPDKLGSKPAKVERARLTSTGPSHEKLLKIQRSRLKENGAFLLDTGFHVYVWVGSKATPATGSAAVHHAETYFRGWKRPALPVTIVKQGRETNAFDKFFADGGKSEGCGGFWIDLWRAIIQ